MPLQAPKKNKETNAYHLALNPPVPSPRLTCSDGAWTLTDDWARWATEQRNQLMGELLSHGNWFSRPPRRDVLEPLFRPWILDSGTDSLSGSGEWLLTGLEMSATAILPVWKVENFQEQETICLIEAESEADSKSEDGSVAETREIQLDDIELSSPAAPPTRIRSREWEGRKFLAKERVRESRLKAQIADRIAAKEESRFYSQFGDLDDNESHFSEYDLTENEEEASNSDSP